MVSEWPARYLVAEWNTMSAPSASGRWMTGDANVLSTTTIGADPRAPRCALAAVATASRSTSLSSGLDGDSIQTMRVRGVSAAWRAAAGSSPERST